MDHHALQSLNPICSYQITSFPRTVPFSPLHDYVAVGGAWTVRDIPSIRVLHGLNWHAQVIVAILVDLRFRRLPIFDKAGLRSTCLT